MKGIGGHHSRTADKDEWITPVDIVRRLGLFDLDPCAPAVPPWDIGLVALTREDDGLAAPWRGRVWCNPPYGDETAKWLKRCADHGDAVALIFARTETAMFFDRVWAKADALLFLKGRLHFYHVDGTRAKGNAGAPSVLVAYGARNIRALHNSGIPGAFVPMNRQGPFSTRVVIQ